LKKEKEDSRKNKKKALFILLHFSLFLYLQRLITYLTYVVRLQKSGLEGANCEERVRFHFDNSISTTLSRDKINALKRHP